MKARVKATGEIVEVEDCGSVFRYGALFHGYKDANDIKYLPNEIELQMDFDYHDETAKYNPDYWTRLEHQYAGMAMQGLVTRDLTIEELTDISVEIAHALVEKLKQKEEEK